MHQLSGTHTPRRTSTKVEAVQRRAAQFVTSNYSTTSSVTAMIDMLEWETLCKRRARAKATMMYWVVHSIVAIQLPPQYSQTGADTRGHQHWYRIPFCRTTVYKETFFRLLSGCGTSCQNMSLWPSPWSPSRPGSLDLQHRRQRQHMILSVF